MTNATLTIRRATAHDGFAIRRLAAMDSSSPLGGEVLLAEVGDELWAALDLDTGVAVADPFRPSGEVAELLRFHADGVRSERRSERRSLTRLLPRAA